MVEGLTYIEDSVPMSSGCSSSLFSSLRRARQRRLPPRGGAVAARRAHNPKVRGSNPFPATNLLDGPPFSGRAISFAGCPAQASKPLPPVVAFEERRCGGRFLQPRRRAGTRVLRSWSGLPNLPGGAGSFPIPAVAEVL